MLILCLSALFLAAPIPKGANDGTIALISYSRKLELILITPEGKEVKRVDLSELMGKRPYAMKMSSDGNHAIITMRSEIVIPVGFNKYPLSVAYLVSLDGKDKPVTLFRNKLYPTLTLNNKGTTVYGSEWDKKSMSKHEKIMSRTFSIDLATKLEKVIPLPVTHSFVGIDNGETTVLINGDINGKNQSLTTPTNTWKPTAHLGAAIEPLCISPDGQKLLLCDQSNVHLGEILEGIRNENLMIYDLKSQKTQIIDKPGKDIHPIRFVFSPDNKRVAVLGFEKITAEDLSTERIYHVYTCKTDGTDLKLIYKTKPNLDWLFDIDWK